jgi:hypothetical protein
MTPETPDTGHAVVRKTGVALVLLWLVGCISVCLAFFVSGSAVVLSLCVAGLFFGAAGMLASWAKK